MSECEEGGKWSWEVQIEQQAKIDELQKRIDSALKITSKMAAATNATALWAYDLDKALRGASE